MFIDKFKKEDGFYYDQNECMYEEAEDFIAIGLLGFCGCGIPNAALDHVRKSLQIVDDLKNLVWENKITHMQWCERKKEVFTNEGIEYFMWYFLDNKGLTEHGGVVPGWLTQEGVELLSDLNELSKSWEI